LVIKCEEGERKDDSDAYTEVESGERGGSGCKKIEERKGLVER